MMDHIDMTKPKSGKPVSQAPQTSPDYPDAWWPNLTVAERDRLFAAWSDLDYRRVVPTASRRWLHDAIHPEGDSTTQLIPQNRRSGSKGKEDTDEYKYNIKVASLYAHALMKAGKPYKAATYEARKKFKISKKDLEVYYSKVRSSGEPIPPLGWFDDTLDAETMAAYRADHAAWERQRLASLSEEEIKEEGGPIVAEWLEETVCPPFWKGKVQLRDFVRSEILGQAGNRWGQLDERLRTTAVQNMVLDRLTVKILSTVEQLCIEEIRDLLKAADHNGSRQTE